MNQELELSEQLINEGFTPFGEISELTEEQIIDKDIFSYIFSIESDINREEIIVMLQIRAKALKVTKQFNKLLKIYREIYIKELKGRNDKITDFKDSPYPNLKCGKWLANEIGILKKDYSNSGQPIIIKASPIPVMPIERLVNIETNIEKVKLAFFKDGKWQEIIAEKNTISSKAKILQLANRGLEVNEDNAKNLITYLADIVELNIIPTKKGISHLGWVEEEFIPYTEEYCLDIDQEFKQKLNNIKEKGDYIQWKEHIKKLRNASIALRFLIASSFASVLTKKFNINTFIVHLWGKSGNGKTVAEMICASIWGKPDENFISNLSNTTIANERLCNFYRNMPVFLDELQIAKTKYKNFDELIYILTEGKGKERGTVDNGLRELTEWQNIIIVTGEEPITSDISKEGVKNRVIEINEDNVIIENGNETVNLIQANYGFAGKEFIELIKDKEKLRTLQKNFSEELSKSIEYKKQVNAFSIIMTADYIVSNEIFNDKPLAIEQIKQYIRNDTEETERIYQQIIEWITQNSNKFINENNTPMTEIWGKYEENSIYVIVKVLTDFLSDRNISFKGIKEKLFNKGCIEKNAKGEIAGNKKINGISCRCVKFIIKQEEEIGEIQNEILPF